MGVDARPYGVAAGVHTERIILNPFPNHGQNNRDTSNSIPRPFVMSSIATYLPLLVITCTTSLINLVNFDWIACQLPTHLVNLNQPHSPGQPTCFSRRLVRNVLSHGLWTHQYRVVNMTSSDGWHMGTREMADMSRDVCKYWIFIGHWVLSWACMIVEDT